MRAWPVRPLVACALALPIAATPFACGLEVVGRADALDASAEEVRAPDAAAAVEAAPPSPCGDTLTSKDNCGACGHVCAASVCRDGVCESEVLATELGTTRSVVALPDVVVVARAGVNPGLTCSLFDAGVQTAPCYATSSIVNAITPYFTTDHVFWLGTSEGVGYGYRLPATGVIYPYGTGIGVYKAGFDGFFTLADGRLVKVNLGASPTYFGSVGGVGQGVTGDDSFVYWANPEVGVIQRVPPVPPDGGAVETFRFGEDRPTTLALDEENVYFTTATAIRRAPKSDPQAVTTLVTDLGAPMALLRDERTLYWIDTSTGDLKRAPIEGGPPLVLARGTGPLPPFPYTSLVGVSGAYVYWVSPSEGTLRRLPK